MSVQHIKLVVFDWAGTVLDFGCQAPAGAFVEAFGQRGVTVSIAEARGPMGLHKKDHIRAMLQAPELAIRWQTTTGAAWTEADVQQLYELVTPMQVAAAKKHADLVPELLECVFWLRQRGIKIAGSTGYFHEAAQACYAAAQQQGYVPDFTICADEVPAGRPEPWMIFRAMEQLRVYPPCAVVKVGDTKIDMEDGKNAGVWTVGVIDSSNEVGLSREDFARLTEAEKSKIREQIANRFVTAGANAAIPSLKQLPQIIELFEQFLRDGKYPS
jgi:phosphonoacetaldehyde hydrolase